MKIAYGNSRMEKKWKNNEISWDDFCKRVSTTQTTTETVDEYRKMSKPQQDAIKDEMCIYSTHKHTPEAPRLRLIMPLKRDISEDEYPAVARKVASEIGMDMFDDTTYQPHRLMYWPSTSANGEYIFRVMEGDVIDPDYYLGLYDDWRDVSTWPVSSRESAADEKSAA